MLSGAVRGSRGQSGAVRDSQGSQRKLRAVMPVRGIQGMLGAVNGSQGQSRAVKGGGREAPVGSNLPFPGRLSEGRGP